MEDFGGAEERAIAIAKAFARTASVSGFEQRVVELAAAVMTAVGFDQVNLDESGNAVGILGSGNRPRLLIDGHVDTIPLHSSDRWTVDPLGGEARDGKLYGLGVCDQKASLAAAIHGVAAANHLQGGLAGTVAVVASVGEEQMEGAALRGSAQRFRPDVAVITEPSSMRVSLGHRGRAKLEVKVTGRPAHSALAHEGLNAADALAALMVKLASLTSPVHDVLGRRDFTVIDVVTAPYPSVSTVPAMAMAHIDCRFLPGDTPESLCNLVSSNAEDAWCTWLEKPGLAVTLATADFHSWNGERFVVPEIASPWLTERDSTLAQSACRALHSVGLDPGPTVYSFCTNGSLTAGELGIPTIGFGVGDQTLAHQVDEHVTLDSIRLGTRAFAALADCIVG